MSNETKTEMTDAEKIVKLQGHCGRLANLALFAINHLKHKGGSGMVMQPTDDAEEYKMTPWKDHFREELGKCGLIVVDPVKPKKGQP